jgi:hypothetical protein
MLALRTTRPSDFAAQEPHLLKPVFLQMPNFFPTTHISFSRPGDAGAQDSTGQQSSACGNFPELSEAHLLLASSAGIEPSTAQSIHLAANEHVALTSSKHISLASGDSMFASIAKTFSLFVHKAGMKLIAASDKVSIQALSDDVEILVKKVLSLISEADWVNIKGKKGVRLQGANHMLAISDKVQFFTSSPVLARMATKSVKRVAVVDLPQYRKGTAWIATQYATRENFHE